MFLCVHQNYQGNVVYVAGHTCWADKQQELMLERTDDMLCSKNGTVTFR